MMLKNVRLTVVLTAFFTFWASPLMASSVLELGAPSKDDSVISLGKAPEKATKDIALGGLRFTKGELPAGRLTLKQRMRKRLRLGRNRNESLSRSNRERLKRVRSGNGASLRDEDRDDIAAFREGRRGDEDEDEEEGAEQDDEEFKDIEDQNAANDEDDPVNNGNNASEDDDVPVRNDADDGDDRRVAEVPQGDAGVQGGVTSAGKTIELKEGARDPNGDMDIGVES